ATAAGDRLEGRAVRAHVHVEAAKEPRAFPPRHERDRVEGAWFGQSEDGRGLTVGVERGREVPIPGGACARPGFDRRSKGWPEVVGAARGPRLRPLPRPA